MSPLSMSRSMGAFVSFSSRPLSHVRVLQGNECRWSRGMRHASNDSTADRMPWSPPSDLDKKESVISIDRSGLRKFYPEGTNAQDAAANLAKKPSMTPLANILYEKIKLRGPLSVASYIRECLTHPNHGYYMGRDVFGESGDFVTSPELSQMFGEMIAIWFVTTWEKLGCPTKLNLVELGPGRGTLSADILKFTSKFPPLRGNVHLHLVEVSPHLRQVQYKNLDCARYVTESTKTAATQPNFDARFSKDVRDIAASIKGVQASKSPNQGQSLAALRADGTRVSWYDSFASVPREEVPTIILAHEFFDALPVHVFEYTKLGWCERLIDIDTSDSPNHFRFVLSPGPTPASAAFMKYRGEPSTPSQKPSIGDVIEVCPNGMAIAEDMAKFLNITKGAALIIDYGADAAFSNSLKAIQKHKIHDFFFEPGKSDLTAMVDFSSLRRTAALAKGANQQPIKLNVQGPVTQKDFLMRMGIDVRLRILLQIATPEQAKILQRGYDILTSETEMGSVFKCMALSVSPSSEKLELLGFPSDNETTQQQTPS